MSRIAVVGSGVAGLTAAYLLQRRHDITIFEKNDYAGGHTHTITLPDGPDAGTPVDTGFIVMNHRNYPLFTRLLEKLQVALRDSDMSFGYWDEAGGLQYSGSDLNTMFAQRRNLFNPAFYGMIRDVLRFYKNALADLDAGRVGTQSLGQYLQGGAYGEYFIRHHLLPMGAAIWSTPCRRMMEFPAASFLAFLRNHGLLAVNDRPTWRTVVGGSQTYVRKMLATFVQPPRLSCGVQRLRRAADGVWILPATGPEERFDLAVVAAHADEALRLLADPSPEEQRLLGVWRYTSNPTVLHHDASALPPIRRARASWNYVREAGGDSDEVMSLTYDMNRLQGLQTSRPCLVSLNRGHPIPPELTVRRLVYEHPTYTTEAWASQQALPQLNGARNTFFCGSYFGSGFHEDAVHSAVQVVRQLGEDL